MIRLDAATVLLQWATGGLAFLWVTTRRREVGIGYGWLVRATYLVFLVASVVVGQRLEAVPVRDVSAALAAIATAAALIVSITRRRAGVRHQREEVDRRSARVADMTGIERDAPATDTTAAEFPPALDLIAPAFGLIGLIAAALDGGSSVPLAILRTVVGAVFLGSVSDAMLLGHWYLVQPGLARGPLLELVRWLGIVWPFEVIGLLLPTGMVSVLNG
ncbi:MAG: hypothetical protein ABIV94_10170, partial [Acidimicrobiales bacterium]